MEIGSTYNIKDDVIIGSIGKCGYDMSSISVSIMFLYMCSLLKASTLSLHSVQSNIACVESDLYLLL